MRILSLIFLFITPAFAGVPLTDNILFAFEKCKFLSVDLEKGTLKEAVASSFDVRCEKVPETKEDLSCSFYDPGSTKALSKEEFTGSSDLGVAELKDKTGKKMKFLIGKSFASYESGPEQKVCIGIYIFEKEALKRKAK